MQGNQQEEFFDIFKAQTKDNAVQPVQKRFKLQPLADLKLTTKILELLQHLLPFKQVRKGVNEILKQIIKNNVEFVIIAADCDPPEIVMTLPATCAENSIVYCFIESKAALGRACGISRPVAAAAITTKQSSPLQGNILQIKDKIQQLFV